MSLIVHRPDEIPDRLPRALENAQLHYSCVREVLHYIWLNGDDIAAGIFGDSDMGCYEWFVWDNGRLLHSDSAFGCIDSAFWMLLSRPERRCV